MEATRTATIDPLAMPQGLTPDERRWWTARANLAASVKREADRLHREAIRDQFLAQHARDDYGRLQSEYRLRHWRKPMWVADILFKGTAVAQNCVVDDGWYSRQASEKFAGANAAYARTVMLMEELERFMRDRRVPKQREAS